MAGWLTNNMVQIGPQTNNGVLTGSPALAAEITSHGLIPVDASNPGPQTAAASAAHIAMIAVSMAANAATSTVHAATLNTLSGSITTEALTTAVGAVYTFTLTNSLITATTNLLFDIRSKSNTVIGLTPTSCVCSAGSAVLTFTNNGNAALNGTMILCFHV